MISAGRRPAALPATRILAAFFVLTAAALRAADWPMLGGRPDRNMVSTEKGLPLEWNEGGKNPRKNIKWVADLGQVTYGAPVIGGGRVFIGTDNDDPAVKQKRGVLKCFSEKDGRLLWRATHEKLSDASEDDSGIGICSTPCIADERVYYVSNRGELVCRAAKDGREIWVLDMRQKLGVSPNQASASSPLVSGELVYVVTGHGTNYRTGSVKNPSAPSFIAVDRATGKVVWQDNSPGGKILTGQWGSPGYGVVDGQPQVAFPGGDGWLYSFEPPTGKLLWKFNTKAHEKISAAGDPETTFNLAAAPVFLNGRVFVAVGEPEASSGPGALRCIDARQRGDVTRTAEVWRLGDEEFHDSLSTVAVHDGLVFAADTQGYVCCIDATTGKRLWSHDVLANIWGSPLVADGKVYVQMGEGAVFVFEAGREEKLLAKNEGLSDVGHGTPVAANGVLYITGQRKLYAIAAEK
ncbi:MAG: PQQ-binding-like beta-propeller repeat protein [Opitutaceae bacterium]|nr:PQQ-binding-like beta-propeller repeat protein [Opitutaceae bacterium]